MKREVRRSQDLGHEGNIGGSCCASRRRCARSLHGTQPSCSRAARAKIACSAPSTGTVGSKRTISGHTRAKKLVFLDSVSMLLPSDKVSRRSTSTADILEFSPRQVRESDQMSDRTP